MKLRENILRVTHKKYYEIHAINRDRTIGQYILSGSATTWSPMSEFVWL